MSDHSAPKAKRPGGPVRWLVLGVLAIATLSLVGGVANKLLDEDEADGGKVATSAKASAPKTVVETLACNPEWGKGGGWCESQSLPAGEYQVKLVRWNYQLATPGGALPVPEEGIPLGRWKGQDFEEQFRKEAPLGSAEKVGVPLYRVTGEKAAVISNSTVSLPDGGSIKVGVNMLPYPDAYQGNTGGMTITISK